MKPDIFGVLNLPNDKYTIYLIANSSSVAEQLRYMQLNVYKCALCIQYIFVCSIFRNAWGAEQVRYNLTKYVQH